MSEILKNLLATLNTKEKELECLKENHRKLSSDIEYITEDIETLQRGINALRGDALPPVHVYVEDNGKIIFELDANTEKDLIIPAKIAYKIHTEKMYNSANTGFEVDDFQVVFSMPITNLKYTIIGKIVFRSEGKEKYESPIVENPTYFEAFQYFQQSIYKTQDKHHIYLEDLYIDHCESTDEITVIRFSTGS